MEVDVYVLGRVEDQQAFNAVWLMLSDDPPIFEDEMAKEWRHVFRALEDIVLPDSFEFKRTQHKVCLYWLMGSSFREDLVDALKRLKRAGCKNLVGYVKEDEAEAFIVLKDGKLVEKKEWRKEVDTGSWGEAHEDVWKGLGYFIEKPDSGAM